MGMMDEASSNIDGFGSVGPDGTSGAGLLVESEPLVKSSPDTAAAAVAAHAAGVEVAPAPNREGRWDRLKQSHREAEHTRLTTSRRTIRVNIMFGTIIKTLNRCVCGVSPQVRLDIYSTSLS